MPHASETVCLLRRMREGDGSASADLMAVLYDELHGIASRLMAGERRDHTLQPTALVHDAWMRLVGARAEFDDRRHFVRTAARAMRRVLVDHARGKNAKKRGGGQAAIEWSEELADGGDVELAVDLLALDEALEALGRHDPELLRIIELRYFAGLTLDETGNVLEMTVQQVHRSWGFARAWLRTEMDA